MAVDSQQFNTLTPTGGLAPKEVQLPDKIYQTAEQRIAHIHREIEDIDSRLVALTVGKNTLLEEMRKCEAIMQAAVSGPVNGPYANPPATVIAPGMGGPILWGGPQQDPTGG